MMTDTFQYADHQRPEPHQQSACHQRHIAAICAINQRHGRHRNSDVLRQPMIQQIQQVILL
ncbi:hypothetical protein D3C86_2002900 [compost metagenome]